MPKVTEEAGSSLLDGLEKGLRIDKNDLDNEWIRHPDLNYQVSKEFALAISRRDEMKLTIGEATATLDKQFRDAAADAGEKITETAIAKQIEGSIKIIDLKRDYARACYRADQWLALKEAYAQRSYALKYLVELYGMGYFASSTGSAQRRDATDREAAKSREAVGEARRETRTRHRAGAQD